MNIKDAVKITPLVKSVPSWQAFLDLLAYEEARCVSQLIGDLPADKLIRINAIYDFIQKLKKTRDIILSLEKGMS